MTSTSWRQTSRSTRACSHGTCHSIWVINVQSITIVVTAKDKDSSGACVPCPVEIGVGLTSDGRPLIDLSDSELLHVTTCIDVGGWALELDFLLVLLELLLLLCNVTLLGRK